MMKVFIWNKRLRKNIIILIKKTYCVFLLRVYSVNRHYLVKIQDFDGSHLCYQTYQVVDLTQMRVTPLCASSATNYIKWTHYVVV